MRSVQIAGGTAHLREEHEIRVRHKRLIETATIGAATALEKLPSDRDELESSSLVELGLSTDEAATLFALQDAQIVASLASWTLPEPIPTLDTIGDMDPAVYEALSLACQETPVGTGGVDFDPPDPNSPAFAESPTVPSADSEGDSKDDQESSSTRPLASNGASTRTVARSPDSLTSST